MILKFMCGCSLDLSVTAAHLDGEGMLICPEHNQRRYGWRSTGRDHKHDFMTPFQYERWRVFGEPPVTAVKIQPPASPNMKDNRDPELVWAGEKLK